MSISAYIKSNENLNRLDFATVYLTIYSLIEDKKISWEFLENV